MSDSTPRFTALPMPAKVSECLERAGNDPAMATRGGAGSGQQSDAPHAARPAPAAAETHGAECLLARYRRPSRPAAER